MNGDILVLNHVTRRRHELSSMCIRVNAETEKKQLETSGQTDFLKVPYHLGIIKSEIPLRVGGGIGQAGTVMLLLRKAHLGEVTVPVWPKVLKEICAKKNICVLDDYEKISECGQSGKALTEPVARFLGICL